ncbi:hypothetical protein [Fulvivirga kasyanovii]|uniref:DUF2892 domain-containing protein n=1 Tax=Fulvivirga kasyanovii TaxID=396812 RepID=A0ABW9RRC0_9BACT|nr:hypothetical protein [Fulvivirga kasyanovii]MTI26277.1 hypothetical protein [Fulvivirga kasyanovii]
MKKTEHAFFAKPVRQQNLFVWKVGAGLLLCILGVLTLAWVLNFYLLVLVVPVLIAVAAPFIDVPMGVKTGQFTHYSPLFIASREHKGEVVVHGGTLFDYYFNLKEVKPTDRKKVILLSYLKGLISVVENYEHEGREDLVIKGTSYMINERTARKMGFRLIATDSFQKIILILNYIPVLIAYSYSKGKLSFPDLSKVITLKASVKTLAEHKAAMLRLVQRLD